MESCIQYIVYNFKERKYAKKQKNVIISLVTVKNKAKQNLREHYYNMLHKKILNCFFKKRLIGKKF